LTVVFLIGIFWEKADERAVFLSLIVGFIFGEKIFQEINLS
jgi:Na+/proline symporter